MYAFTLIVNGKNHRSNYCYATQDLAEYALANALNFLNNHCGMSATGAVHPESDND